MRRYRYACKECDLEIAQEVSGPVIPAQTMRCPQCLIDGALVRQPPRVSVHYVSSRGFTKAREAEEPESAQ